MAKYIQIWISRVTIILIIVLLTYGCRSISPSRTSKITPGVLLDREKEGFYYVVDEGETLTQISKKYNVSVEKLAQLNHLPDKDRITVGQLIFIPKAIEKYGLEKGIVDSEVNFIWPVRGKVISFFSKEKGNMNLGIDIKVPLNTKIVAAEGGKVVYCNNIDNKEIIIIKHPKNFSSHYIYKGKALVTKGEQVVQGQPILEKEGGTGLEILHFEIRKQHLPQNPYYFLP